MKRSSTYGNLENEYTLTLQMGKFWRKNWTKMDKEKMDKEKDGQRKRWTKNRQRW
jgi:hypothetical protein